MAKIISYPTNPSINEEFIVGSTIKLWDGEKWVNKSFGNHEERLQVDRQTLEALINSYGKSLAGLFDLGFSYTESNAVGVKSDGTFWEYTGALPHTVTKGTDPSLDVNYEQWEFATLDTLTADEIEPTTDRIWFTPELQNELQSKLESVDLSSVASATNVVVSNTEGDGFTISLATDTLAGLLDPQDKVKIDSLEDGAQVNTVDSVNTKSGNVVLEPVDLGLGNVDNTSDLDKPISTATQSALGSVNSRVDTTEQDIDLLEQADLTFQERLDEIEALALAGL